MEARVYPSLKDPESGVTTVFPKVDRIRPKGRNVSAGGPPVTPPPSSVHASMTAPAQAPPAASHAAAYAKPTFPPQTPDPASRRPVMKQGASGGWTAAGGGNATNLTPPGKTEAVKMDTPDLLRDIRPTEGSAVQLAALGPEDKYLTIDPSYSPFRFAYKKHTPFAVNREEESFSNGFLFGRTCTLGIGLRGDLLNDAWLEIQLPAVTGATGTWVPWVGYALAKEWRFYIGDVLVQSVPREWTHFLHVSGAPATKIDGLDSMVGKDALDITVAHTLYVPVPLFFAQAASTAEKNPLPICALSNASSRTAGVKVEVDVETFANLVNLTTSTELVAPSSMTCTAVLDYVILSDEERASFIGFGNRLLFKTVLASTSRAYTYTPAGGTAELATTRVRLGSINLPVASFVTIASDENAAQNKTLFTYRTVDSLDLFLTSQKRFDTRPGDYFSKQQFYSFGARVPPLGSNIYPYSFAAPWTPGKRPRNAGHVDSGSAFSEPTMCVHGVGNAASPPALVTVLAEVYSFLTCERGFASVDRVG